MISGTRVEAASSPRRARDAAARTQRLMGPWSSHAAGVRRHRLPDRSCTTHLSRGGRMRKLGLVGAVLIAVACGGGSSRPLDNGSGSGGGSPDGGSFAPAPPSTVTLSVQIVGSGSGRIVSSPTGIDCPGTCAMEIASGTPVKLNSAANPGSSFDGFGGGCSGLLCASNFSADTIVYANFRSTVVTPVLHTLSVSVTG